jgi:hypothetical protein
MGLFSWKRSVPGGDGQGHKAQSQQATSMPIQFAETEGEVVAKSPQEVLLKLPPATFTDLQLQALAEYVQLSFIGKFQHPIRCTSCADGVLLIIDDSERSQPLKVPFQVKEIRTELLGITDDRGLAIFLTRQNAIDHLNRKIGRTSITSEVLPIALARAQLTKVRDATHLVFGVVARALVNANLLKVDERVTAIINGALEYQFSQITEDLARYKYEDDVTTSALNERTNRALKFEPQFKQPPKDLEPMFAIPVLILEVVLEDLSRREILFLSEPVVEVVNQALVDLYIDAALAR